MSDFLARITRPDVQQFIWDEELTDAHALVLRRREILGLPSSWIAAQIAGRRKSKEKLPLWYQTPGIVYPPGLNLEQCSSEATARFKQTIITGTRVADLTGGFGIDTYFLSRNFQQVDSIEPDEALSSIAAHNHRLLGATNIRYHTMTAEKFISSGEGGFDALYIDPSRRNSSRKVIRLADAAPNVVSMHNALVKLAPHVVVKSSPLLDLKQAYRELPSIDQFFVVAHENECKELLLFLRRNRENPEPIIHAVNLNPNGGETKLTFTWSDEKSAVVSTGEPMTYLYEPNAAILKSGAFKFVARQYDLIKLSADSHLYTSDTLLDDFPGRVFRVLRVLALNRTLRKSFENGKANILIRNFPQTVDAVKKLTGLTEGGTDYLICAKSSKPIALHASRLR